MGKIHVAQRLIRTELINWKASDLWFFRQYHVEKNDEVAMRGAIILDIISYSILQYSKRVKLRPKYDLNMEAALNREMSQLILLLPA